MLIKLFGSLRLHGAGSKVEVSLCDPGPTGAAEPATVALLLDRLFALHPALRENVVVPDGTALLPHVNIMRNGRLIRDLQGLQTPVSEDDVIAIFPPSAGG